MHFLFSKSTTWKRLHKFCSVHDLKYCTVTNNNGSCSSCKVWKWLANAHARSMTPHEVGKSFDFLVHLAPFQPAFGFKGFRFWEEFAVSKHSKQISLNMSLQEKKLIIKYTKCSFHRFWKTKYKTLIQWQVLEMTPNKTLGTCAVLTPAGIVYPATSVSSAKYRVVAKVMGYNLQQRDTTYT